MPNGAQEQAEEGEASGGESEEEWQSDGEGEEDDDGSSEEEEEEVDPPRTERRSKLIQDPASLLGSRQNTLGRLLRRRLKKRQSIHGRRHQGRRRPCPR